MTLGERDRVSESLSEATAGHAATAALEAAQSEREALVAERAADQAQHEEFAEAAMSVEDQQQDGALAA